MKVFSRKLCQAKLSCQDFSWLLLNTKKCLISSKISFSRLKMSSFLSKLLCSFHKIISRNSKSYQDSKSLTLQRKSFSCHLYKTFSHQTCSHNVCQRITIKNLLSKLRGCSINFLNSLLANSKSFPHSRKSVSLGNTNFQSKSTFLSLSLILKNTRTISEVEAVYDYQHEKFKGEGDTKNEVK